MYVCTHTHTHTHPVRAPCAIVLCLLVVTSVVPRPLLLSCHPLSMPLLVDLTLALLFTDPKSIVHPTPFWHRRPINAFAAIAVATATTNALQGPNQVCTSVAQPWGQFGCQAQETSDDTEDTAPIRLMPPETAPRGRTCVCRYRHSTCRHMSGLSGRCHTYISLCT